MEAARCRRSTTAGPDHYTMWTTSSFRMCQSVMGNFVLNIPQHKLRIVA